MKGFTRRVDDLGRVVIPKEIRASYHLEENAYLRIIYVPAGILLEPLNASCGICGSTKNLLFVDGIAICRAHAEALVRAMEGRDDGQGQPRRKTNSAFKAPKEAAA